MKLELLLGVLADDVRNMVALVDVLLVLEHLLRHRNVREGFGVGVLAGVLVEPLGDDVAFQWEGSGSHLGGDLLKVGVDLVDDDLLRRAKRGAFLMEQGGRRVKRAERIVRK